MNKIMYKTLVLVVVFFIYWYVFMTFGYLDKKVASYQEVDTIKISKDSTLIYHDMPMETTWKFTPTGPLPKDRGYRIQIVSPDGTDLAHMDIDSNWTINKPVQAIEVLLNQIEVINKRHDEHILQILKQRQ